MKNSKFFSFKLNFFGEGGGGYWEKRRIFWIGNGAEYRTLVIGRKGPVQIRVTHPTLSVAKHKPTDEYFGRNETRFFLLLKFTILNLNV